MLKPDSICSIFREYYRACGRMAGVTDRPHSQNLLFSFKRSQHVKIRLVEKFYFRFLYQIYTFLCKFIPNLNFWKYYMRFLVIAPPPPSICSFSEKRNFFFFANCSTLNRAFGLLESTWKFKYGKLGFRNNGKNK